MYTITTSPSANGRGIVAKGHGKQRTTPVDPDRTFTANHAGAAGTLLNVLLDDKQQSKLRHPSGAQRVREERLDSTRVRWSVNV